MNVLSPSQWRARVDYDTWDDPYTPDEGVVIHHGGGADYGAAKEPFSQDKEIIMLQSWESYHFDIRGWRGLAYGWGIGQTGTIYRIRGWNSYGAHRGDIDGDGIANNEELIPIIWILSGNQHRPSQAMQDSTEWLRRGVIEPRAPGARQLYGHKEVQTSPTTCPGPFAMVYVESHRFLEEDTMRRGDEGKQVAELQHALVGLWGQNIGTFSPFPGTSAYTGKSFRPGEDGDFGGATESGIKAVQKGLGLAESGVVDGVTAGMVFAKYGGAGGISKAQVEQIIADAPVVHKGEKVVIKGLQG